jgi:methylmalonyl-CoA mutase
MHAAQAGRHHPDHRRHTFVSPAGEPDHVVELRRAIEACRCDYAAQAGRNVRRNIFDVLMDAARVCTLGQVTDAFFEVGGQYRRKV